MVYSYFVRSFPRIQPDPSDSFFLGISRLLNPSSSYCPGPTVVCLSSLQTISIILIFILMTLSNDYKKSLKLSGFFLIGILVINILIFIRGHTGSYGIPYYLIVQGILPGVIVTILGIQKFTNKMKLIQLSLFISGLLLFLMTFAFATTSFWLLLGFAASADFLTGLILFISYGLGFSAVLLFFLLLGLFLSEK